MDTEAAEYLASAAEAGKIRRSAAAEFLRLVASKTDRWVAQKMVEAEFAERMAIADAVVEVKLAYLKIGGRDANQSS